MLGVIGGSGLYSLEGLAVDDRLSLDTRYGKQSAPVVTGRLGEGRLAFLPRHGEDHSIAPHLINYRANLAALQEAGVTRVLAVCSAGGISPEAGPGSVVVPDQLIDYTWGRRQTIVEEDWPVSHIDFTRPFSDDWRSRVIEALAGTGAGPVDGGTCAVMQGPRLETSAEIRRLASDGCDLVNMTAMPEAALARELELEYAIVCPIVNWAAGVGAGGIDVPGMAELLVEPMRFIRTAIADLV